MTLLLCVSLSLAWLVAGQFNQQQNCEFKCPGASKHVGVVLSSTSLAESFLNFSVLRRFERKGKRKLGGERRISLFDWIGCIAASLMLFAFVACLSCFSLASSFCFLRCALLVQRSSIETKQAEIQRLRIVGLLREIVVWPGTGPKTRAKASCVSLTSAAAATAVARARRQCCNEHDMCYHTCGKSLKECDDNFEKWFRRHAMQRSGRPFTRLVVFLVVVFSLLSKHEANLQVRRVADAACVRAIPFNMASNRDLKPKSQSKDCESEMKTMTFGARMFGCKSYIDSQREACLCPPKKKTKKEL